MITKNQYIESKGFSSFKEYLASKGYKDAYIPTDFRLKENWNPPYIIRDIGKELSKCKTQEERDKIFTASRKGWVGGSAAGAVMGCDPYKTILDLYLDYHNYTQAPISEYTQNIFDSGHRCEAYVRNWFSEITGLKTLEWELQAVNPKYPHLMANIDGLVIEDGKYGIYEGKHTTPFTNACKNIWKNGNVPQYNEYQARFYMGIWDLDFAYICCAWGFRGEDIVYKKIERDLELEKIILESCEQFAINTEYGIKPTNVNVSVEQHRESIRRMYPTVQGKKEILSESYKYTCERYKTVDNEIKILSNNIKEMTKANQELQVLESCLKEKKKEKEELIAVLETGMKDAETVIATADTFELNITKTTKKPKISTSNIQKLKEKYPMIFEEFFEVEPKINIDVIDFEVD